jgi:probable F420-dependent oxidoreductase
MRVGIHLPQFGRAAIPGAIERAAQRAEEVGFDDVWVSDHLVVPKGQPYPTPYLCDPLISLAFAAAATSTIGIGTSVLVGPQYTSPLALANSLATLDNMCGGRLTVGIGIGWSKAEYEALGAPWDHRGARLDEIIELLRIAWREDPSSYAGRFYPFHDVRVLPKPAHEVPIWVGGSSDAAFRRALTKGDGWHGIGVKPEDAKPVVHRIRADRPEPEFTISLRMSWDAKTTQPREMRQQFATYEQAGFQHVLVAPDRGDVGTWLAGIESIADTLGLHER